MRLRIRDRRGSLLMDLKSQLPLDPDSAIFPPAHRLHAPREYGRVFAKPIRSSDRYFTMLARPNHVDTARLGLAISRKVAKRAVDRNRMKRMARESFRQLRLPPADFVVLGRGPAATATQTELRNSLDMQFASLLRRLERRKDG